MTRTTIRSDDPDLGHLAGAECGCTVPWTQTGTRALRRREGLPGRWR